MTDKLKETLEARFAALPPKPEPALVVAPEPAAQHGTLSTPEILAQMVAEERRGDQGAIVTGYMNLDDGMTRPMRPGEVMGIGARTGIGKTWLTQSITLHNVERDPSHHAVFLTLEQPGWEMGTRVAAHVLKTSPRDVGSLALAGEDVAAQVMTQAPYLNRVRWYDMGASVDDIAGICDHASEAWDGAAPTILVIDYMGLLRWEGARNATRYEQTSEIARRLKDRAKALRVCLICAIQLSRGGGRDGTHEPGLDALRDSGAIEEAADRILLFWRDPEGEDDPLVNSEIRGKIAKNRHGASGARTLLRYDESLRLHEVSEYQIASPSAGWNSGDGDLPY